MYIIFVCLGYLFLSLSLSLSLTYLLLVVSIKWPRSTQIIDQRCKLYSDRGTTVHAAYSASAAADHELT